MGLYDNIYLLQHRKELLKVEQGRWGECVPIHVRLEPTELCNFRCAFCWWHNPEKRRAFPHLIFSGKTMFDRERFLTLIDEMADLGTRALSFTGSGDPLMHPHMAEMLDKVVERRLVFGVTSNMAMPMSDHLINSMARASWLRWSMNAGSLETFLAVANPRGSDREKTFCRVQENIRRINLERHSRAVFPDFNASYVVFRENEADIYAAAKLARELGLDSIAFRPDTPFERQENPNAYTDHARHLMDRAQRELSIEGFHVHMNDVRQHDVRKTGNPGLICYYSNHTVYIDSRGDVYPCCYTRYHSRYIMGNIMSQPFNEFWASAKRRSFYRHLLQDSCPSCGYGRFNQALQRLYQGEAKAENIAEHSDPINHFI